jgi:DNA-binding SARP family transcriptional activator
MSMAETRDPVADSTSAGVAGSETQPVQVFTLGSFQVVVHGRVLQDDAWRRRKARQLFKCLLSSPQRHLSKDEAIEFFWPESDPDAASTNLRSTVHALRQALDPPGDLLVVEDRGGYSIRPDAEIWVDAEAFEAAIRQGRRSDDPFPILERANGLYRGDYLPDDIYEEWAVRRRDQLKRAWTELQFTLARLANERNEPQHAVAALERLLLADASDELAAQELMRLLGRHGRRAAALRVYQRLGTALRDDLGVEPSVETSELYRQLASEPGLLNAAPSRSDGQPARPVGLRPHLLDRRHNLPSELSSLVGRADAINELRRRSSIRVCLRSSAQAELVRLGWHWLSLRRCCRTIQTEFGWWSSHPCPTRHWCRRRWLRHYAYQSRVGHSSNNSRTRSDQGRCWWYSTTVSMSCTPVQS